MSKAVPTRPALIPASKAQTEERRPSWRDVFATTQRRGSEARDPVVHQERRGSWRDVFAGQRRESEGGVKERRPSFIDRFKTDPVKKAEEEAENARIFAKAIAMRDDPREEERIAARADRAFVGDPNDANPAKVMAHGFRMAGS